MTSEPFGPPPGDPMTLVAPGRDETEQEYRTRMIRRRNLELTAAKRELRARRVAAVRKAAPEVLSNIVELAGIAIIAYGVWTMWPWLGVVIAGIGVTILGMAISPPTRRAPRPPTAPARTEGQ